MDSVPLRLRMTRKRGDDISKRSKAANGLEVVSCAKTGWVSNMVPMAPGIYRHRGDDRGRCNAVFMRYFLELRDERIGNGYACLRGRNLACWCKLCDKHAEGKPWNEDCPDCQPCHVDVLIRLANEQAG